MLSCFRRVSFLIGLAFASSLYAQVDTGTITGRIVDATGAAVSNVQVKLVQTETNFQFAAVTNSEGIYRIQSLQPGTYQATFEGSGFKRVVQGNITLHTGDVLPVNVTLEVGSVNESIQVTAQSTLLETETSSTGTVSEGDTLYKLPLYQRYITNSMSLVPGLTVQTTGGTAGLSAYTVDGQRNTGTGMFEDGVFGVDPLASALPSSNRSKFRRRSQSADRNPARGIRPFVERRDLYGQKERHELDSRAGFRLRPNAQHDAPAVLQLVHYRATAAREPERRALLVHGAGCECRRPDRHSEGL